jgi:hypothetical protein
MRLVHIDGVNQLADALTKMNVHVDLHGRTVFSRSCFLDRRITPLRASAGQHVRVRGPAQSVKPPKGSTPPDGSPVLSGPATTCVQTTNAKDNTRDDHVQVDVHSGTSARGAMTDHNRDSGIG